MTISHAQAILQESSFIAKFLKAQADKNELHWTFTPGYPLSEANQHHEESFDGWIVLAIHTQGSIDTTTRYYGKRLLKDQMWSHMSRSFTYTDHRR